MAVTADRVPPPVQSGKTRSARHPWLAVMLAAARTPRGAVGLGLAAIVVLVAVIGPFVAARSPYALLTVTYAKPSGQLPLGSDFLGRDVLSRVLNGGWTLLLMAAAATAFGIVTGTAAGVSAAYRRGRIDGFIMRTVDVILAATLDITERDYVKVVELQGMRPRGVMVKEILPNLISPLMVEAGLRLTYSIVIMAGLSFLGFGQQPPAANWALMINENREGMQLNPWAVIVPAALIALLTIGTNTFTDAVARVTLGVERRPEEAVLVDDLGLGGTT